MTILPILSWWIVALCGVAAVSFTAWALVRRPSTAKARKAAVLRCAAVVLLLLAALRPGWAGGNAATASTDVDVYFVVDASTSMAADDYGSGTRLDGVRSDIAVIAERLAGAKFALITFDDSAALRMPLSRDTTALATAVEILQPQRPRYANGSSITAGGKLLNERLRAAREKNPGRPALVFYAGDGENTAARQPASLGVDASLVAGGAVLGYGTADGGRMKDTQGDTGYNYVQDTSDGGRRDAVSRIDEEQLRGLAGQLGVPYVHRDAGAAAEAMLAKAEPGSLSAGEHDTQGRVELYWLLALCAFPAVITEVLRHAASLRELRRFGTSAVAVDDAGALRAAGRTAVKEPAP